MVESIFSIGLRGMQTGLENAARDASRISQAFSPDSTEDPVGPAISLKADERQVQASANVIKIGQSMQDAILDIMV